MSHRHYVIRYLPKLSQRKVSGNRNIYRCSLAQCTTTLYEKIAGILLKSISSHLSISRPYRSCVTRGWSVTYHICFSYDNRNKVQHRGWGVVESWKWNLLWKNLLRCNIGWRSFLSSRIWKTPIQLIWNFPFPRQRRIVKEFVKHSNSVNIGKNWRLWNSIVKYVQPKSSRSDCLLWDWRRKLRICA